MEELDNLTQDDVLELITDFPITPLRDVVIITTNVEEWDELVAAKFPQIQPGTGKISYPDIKVRKAVEKETKLQNDAKKK